MNQRELNEQDILQAEEQASRAEVALRDAIAENEADAAEVAYAMRELKMRLEEEMRRGARGLEELNERFQSIATPSVPTDRHHDRMLEARADGVRARMWVVAAMQDDLKRFAFELAEVVALVDEAREALVRVAETPRINVTRRFDRIRIITGDLVAERQKAQTQQQNPRRQQPRVRLETVIDLHSDSNFFRGFSENISDGGVFVATEEMLTIGTEVDLAFSLPDGVEIRGRGAVRWLRRDGPEAPAGIGVQFLNLSGAARDAVQNFLGLREPIFHPE